MIIWTIHGYLHFIGRILYALLSLVLLHSGAWTTKFIVDIYLGRISYALQDPSS